jgi:NAD-dependent dihydropyrimidine dehydrogenase PreA subunit
MRKKEEAMTAPVYEQLAETLALRNEPFGGVCPVVKCTELYALLEHLFTPEEAEIGAKMPLNPISAEALAQDIGRDPQDVEKLLEKMADKGMVINAGAVFGVVVEGGEGKQYILIPLMPGSIELQMVRDVVDDRSKEFARVLQGYFTALSRLKEAGAPAAIPTASLSRVAVAEDTIPAGAEVLPYDKVSKYVADSDWITLATCGCKNVGKLLGHPCDKPSDVCIAFHRGPVPDGFAESSLGRLLSKEEALKTLDRAEKAGLVHVITNVSEGVVYCCNCCMDHCMTLRALKSPVMFAGPAPSSFIMVVDEDECMGCGDCIDRCQFEALSMQDDIVARDADRCFGCGVCVSVCPTSALRMEPREQRPTPCKDYGELIQMMAASWRSDPKLPGGDTEYFLVSD